MVPPLALILNIIVASMALIHYARAGHLSLSFSAPFLTSIPFAFVAGFVVFSQKDLALIFVMALFAASAALLTSARWIKRRHDKIKKMNVSKARLALIGAPTGATLGSIAGIVGIGGGIWLSPLLILTGLADPKRAAATASLFILTNSISGFVAHSVSKPIDIQFLLPLALVVLAGGLIGSRLGAFKFNHDKIRMIVGALVAVAATIITLNQLLLV